MKPETEMPRTALRPWGRWLRKAAWFGLRAVLARIALAWIGLKFVPLPPALLQGSAQSLELTDRHGVPLRETRTDEHFARAVALRDVPPNLVHAMLAAEDKRFFEHRGVDVVALARAAFANLRHGRVTSGASTITQQLVKLSDGTWIIVRSYKLIKEKLYLHKQCRV